MTDDELTKHFESVRRLIWDAGTDELHRATAAAMDGLEQLKAQVDKAIGDAYNEGFDSGVASAEQWAL